MYAGSIRIAGNGTTRTGTEIFSNDVYVNTKAFSPSSSGISKNNSNGPRGGCDSLIILYGPRRTTCITRNADAGCRRDGKICKGDVATIRRNGVGWSTMGSCIKDVNSHDGAAPYEGGEFFTISSPSKKGDYANVESVCHNDGAICSFRTDDS